MDSFFAWIGGKKLLRKEICARFPDGGFDKYVEVFGGAAWVLFYKERHAEMEIYNDVNGNLVNLFRCVKYHPSAIQEEFEYVLNSREVFENFKDMYKSKVLTDIQRAAMYLYIIKASYASKARNYGAKARDITAAEYLKTVKERLKAVVIENRDYETLITQYDRPSSLFYCDPPYLGTERYYDTVGATFDLDHHRSLANILQNIKGRCIISYNDSEVIRELYKDFSITEVARTNNMGMRYGTKKKYSELIIKNY